MNIFNDPRQPSTSTNEEIIASEMREDRLTEAYADGRRDEREEISAAIERAGFRLMESGSGLFLLNVQDEGAAE